MNITLSDFRNILGKMDAGIDAGKRAAFKTLVNDSPILSGKNDLKMVLGLTFLGFNRVDVAACVGKYLAHIKAMTLDEMTWHYTSTGEELSVADAFKVSLDKMLHAFGQGRMPVTRTRQLFAAPPAPPPAFRRQRQHRERPLHRPEAPACG